MAARQLENEAKLKVLNAMCDYPRAMKVRSRDGHRRDSMLFPWMDAYLLVVSFPVGCRTDTELLSAGTCAQRPSTSTPQQTKR
jgi:hypothetical protein